MTILEKADSQLFALDDRTLAQRLQAWRAYTALVPLVSATPMITLLARSGQSTRAPDSEGLPDAIIEPALDGLTLADLFFGAQDQSEQVLTPQDLAHMATEGLDDGAELLPHQALLLGFWRMLETPRELLNALPMRHRELYYRQLLGLHEQPAVADQVVLSFGLAAGHAPLLIPAGTLFDGGRTVGGSVRQYALEASVLVNQAIWDTLRWSWKDESNQLHEHTVYDLSNGVAWPEGGLRLFSPQPEETLARSGRVIGAALLDLRGGQRNVTVHFSAAVDPQNVRAWLSSADGWLAMESAIEQSAGSALTFSLGPDRPRAAAPAGLDGFDDGLPLLKLECSAFMPLPAIESLHVDVFDVPDIHFTTAAGRPSRQGVGEVFGSRPQAGAAVELMVPEWYGKAGPLLLTLTPQWLGVPAQGLDSAYAGDDHSRAFEANVWLASERGLLPLADAPLRLFATADGRGLQPQTLHLTLPVLKPLAVSRTSSRRGSEALPSRIRLELRGDFGQQRYLETDLNQPAGEPLPRPYVPQWRRLQVDYRSLPCAPEVQYILGAFGHAAVTPEPLALIGSDAQLELGFIGLRPGDTLSLYWNLKSPVRNDLEWYYQANDGSWKTLDPWVDDRTDGLFHSDLWHAELPADAGPAGGGQALEPLLVRVAITPTPPTPASDEVSDYPWLQGLQINCAVAVRDLTDPLASAEFDGAVPAGTITRPLTPLEGLQRIEQSWSSLGGIMAQTTEQFLAHCARRLGHRNRALTRDEIISLLLERFPEVHTVVAAEDLAPAVDGQRRLELVVIAANSVSDNLDPLRPRFNPARLRRMVDELAGYLSPWLQCSLRNPTYEDIPVSFELVYQPSLNRAYGEQQVRQALREHYMAWAWDLHSTVLIAGHPDYYQMLAFIQGLPEVQRVIRLTLPAPAPSDDFGLVPILTFT